MLIFSDLHYGLNDDNEQRLNDADQCIDWIIEEGKKHEEKICVFAGDFSHNRYKIGVNTADRMKEAVRKLNDTFEETYLIAGNHDFYYNNDDRVCVLDLFSKFERVHTVINSAQEINYNGKRILLTPWFYNPNEEIGGKYDAMIGHFEFVGAKLKDRFSDRGYDIKSLLAVSPLVFSGHYHLTSEYEKENGKLIVIGSPYQQDWSDIGDDKRIILFDGTKFEVVQNQLSPNYLKIPYEKIKDLDEEMLKQLFKYPKFKNGIIKLMVSGEVDYEKVQKILSAGSVCEIRSIEPDYSQVSSTISESIISEMEKGVEKSSQDYVIDFISNAIDADNSPYASLDKKEMNNLVDSYFSKLNH